MFYSLYSRVKYFKQKRATTYSVSPSSVPFCTLWLLHDHVNEQCTYREVLERSTEELGKTVRIYALK